MLPQRAFFSWFLFAFLFLLLPDKSSGQCRIITGNDTTISCGNQVQLKAFAFWQNFLIDSLNPFAGSAVHFASLDTGYAISGGGRAARTFNGGKNWSMLYIGTGQSLETVFAVNDSTVFVGGGDWGNSLLIKSSNYGNTWTALNTGVNHPIRSLFFTNKDTGFAVGGNDLTAGYFILKTVNGGTSWIKTDSAAGFVLRSIYFVNPQLGFACGSGGKVLRTQNGGLSWYTCTTGYYGYLMDIQFPDSLHGFAVGDYTMLRTSDGGNTWTASQLGSSYPLQWVHFTDSLSGFVANTISLLRTWNGGLDWQVDFSSFNQAPIGHSFPDAHTGYIVGSNGLGLKYQAPLSYQWSPSAGLSATNIFNPVATPATTTKYLITATFREACIASDSVTISVTPFYIQMPLAKTTTCGMPVQLGLNYHNYYGTQPLIYCWWPGSRLNDSTLDMPKATPIANENYHIRVRTPNGCEAEDSMEVSVQPMTVDAGFAPIVVCGDSIPLRASTHWINVGNVIGSYGGNVMIFLNADTGYHFGSSVMRTVDGGRTWNNVFMSTSGLLAAQFVNSSVGYAAGNDGMVLKTLNGGNTWSFNWIYSQQLKGLWFTHPDTGIVVGNNGIIRKTLNGGNTWLVRTSGTTQQLNAVCFSDSRTGIIVGKSGTILRTTNGGDNWSAISSGTTYDLTEVVFTDSLRGHIAGNSRTYLRTFDGGLTWLASNGPIWDARSMRFVDPKHGYMAGQTGAVGAIATTEDGGNTWNAVEYGNYSNLYALSILDTNTGFVMANGMTSGILRMPPRADRFTWTPALGLDHSDIINPIARPPQFMMYHVTVDTKGCLASDSITAYVIPLTVDAGPQFVMLPDLICGTEYQFDTLRFNKKWADVSWSWSPTEGLNDSLSPHPKALLKDHIRYQVRATTPNGCIATDSVYIYVNPFRIEAGPATRSDPWQVCGTWLTLDSLQGNSPEPGIRYAWYPAAGMKDSTSVRPILRLSNSKTYTATATTPNGCVALDSVEIYVMPLTVNAGTEKQAFCGTITALDSAFTNVWGSDSSITYSWFPATGLNRTDRPAPSTTENNIRYTLTVQNGPGCVASDSTDVYLGSMPPTSICMVTVDSSNHNLVIWERPMFEAIDTVMILRETNITGQFAMIAKVPNTQQNSFVDNLSNPRAQSYRYQIVTHDSCGMTTQPGTPHKTMHLTINKGVGNTWNLIWTLYEGFVTNTCNIFRGTDANNLNLIGTVAGTNTTYTDLNAPAGDIYYQVELVRPMGCELNKMLNSSRSNTASNLFIGNNEISISMSFEIFPNPSNEKIEVRWKGNGSYSELRMYNLQGEVVKYMKDRVSPVVMSLQDLPDGIYLVELRNAEGSGWGKVVVAR